MGAWAHGCMGAWIGVYLRKLPEKSKKSKLNTGAIIRPISGVGAIALKLIFIEIIKIRKEMTGWAPPTAIIKLEAVKAWKQIAIAKIKNADALLRRFAIQYTIVESKNGKIIKLKRFNKNNRKGLFKKK